MFTLSFVFLLGVHVSVCSNPELYRHRVVVDEDSLGRVEVEGLYRLKAYWRPLRYNISLIPFLPENFTFDGRVEVVFEALREQDTIVVHKNMIVVRNETVQVERLAPKGDSGARSGNKNYFLDIKSLAEDVPRHFFIITLTENLTLGRRYRLSMDYTGQMKDDMLGFYRSSYRSKDGEKKWIGTTQFEAVYARRAFPCFDEPSLKAKFIINISRLGNMTSISNMPQDGQPVKHMDTPDGVGRYWDTFKETPLMSTYIVAFCVSDFAHLSDARSNLRIFTQPSMIDQAKYALSITPAIVNCLGEYTGIKFSLPKMDQVAVPDFDAAAMENWGLITYSEAYLLYQEGVTSTKDKMSITSTIIHELAHQWFGNLVTLQWWTWTWLNEGFATYFEDVCMESINKSWRMDEEFVVSDYQSSLRQDYFSKGAMSQPVESPYDIGQKFDSISYAKGASIIRMMAHVMTPKIFQKGIRKYLANRKYNNAIPKDLFSALRSQLEKENPKGKNKFDLEAVMSSWTEQPGHPVIHVVREYETSKVTVNQTRFGWNILATDKAEWYVPLTYTTQTTADFSSTTTRRWLKPGDGEIVITDLSVKSEEWILFNIQVTGYYRVNYDVHNWNLLATFLDCDQYGKIPPANRAKLIDDSFTIAKVALQSYCLPLSLIRYLEKEFDYIPWVTAASQLNKLNNQLITHPEYTFFKEFFLKLLKPVYEKVGFVEKPSDSHVTKLLRELVVQLACGLDYTPCVETAVAIFKRYMEASYPFSRSANVIGQRIPSSSRTGVKNEVSVLPDVKMAVYCTALKKGTDVEWNFLWKKFETTTSATDKILMLTALGCTKHKASLERYMKLLDAKDSLIRSQDRVTVYSSILENNKDFALDFITRNPKNMEIWKGFLYFSTLNTPRQLAKLQKLVAAVSEDMILTFVLESILGIVKVNIEMAVKTGREVLVWVKQEMTGSGERRRCPITDELGGVTEVVTSPAIGAAVPKSPKAAETSAGEICRTYVVVVGMTIFAGYTLWSCFWQL